MKTILVSGGSSTLGSAICRHFIARGDRVLCAYHMSGDQARLLSEELGPRLRPLALDLQPKPQPLSPALLAHIGRGAESL